jgi:Fe-S cluster biogenesis protein NfuA
MAVDRDALEDALAIVRPLILGHGGDVIVNDIDDIAGVVSVELVGACRACPNISMTYVGPLRSALLAVDGVAEVRCRQVRASQAALARVSRLLGAHPFPG